METDWTEKRAKVDAGVIRNFLSWALDMVFSTSERDKYRTRLEHGSQTGTTEIYISHRGMEEVYTGHVSADRADTRWQPRPPDPDLEAEMLRRLLVRFGVDDSRAKSQVAAAQPAVQRATLSKGDDGAGTLALNEQFDRAWRRVGLALDRVGFTVEDRDRSKGLYFVRYIDPQIDNKSEDTGFLAKLKFWGSDKPKSNEQFRIQVKDGDAAGCQVNVLNKDGAREQSDTAGRILALLYEQLK
jgi:outer membrane protein assembly factor BamC